MAKRSRAGTGHDDPSDGDSRRNRWRRPLAGFLAVVAALSLVFAVTATWVRTTLLDTDAWVETVAPLPGDADLQQIIGERVASEVLTLVDLPTLLGDTLGPAGTWLAAPAADASKGFIEDATIRVLASPEFESIWLEANRVAHEAAVKVVRGEVAAAELTDGQVTLDLVPLINNVIAQIANQAPGLFGGTTSVPQVSAQQVDQAATNLADALDITIPPDFGQVPVFDTQAVSAAQDVVRWLDDGVVALWVLFALALTGSIVASIDRRRSIAFVGIVTAVSAVLVWLLRRPLETDILGEIENPTGKQVGQIVIDVALWENLGPLILALIAVSLLVTAAAWLSGPSRSAVTVRRTVAGLFGDHRPQTTASVFMRRHTTAFRIVGAVAALVALISITDLTWGWFLTITVVLVAYEVSWTYVEPIDQPSEPAATTS